MQHVDADRVPPVHLIPAEAMREVLKSHVVFAIVIPEAVDIVHPTALKAEMELAAVRLVLMSRQLGKFRVMRRECAEIGHANAQTDEQGDG
jgi:hypothetical protein